MKGLPTKVIRQPVGQQKGCVDGQWQCFWGNQYPIPSLDQSVARHVGFVLSNIRTPSCISLTIKDLDLDHDRTSVMLVGVGKSWIASRYLLHGRTVSIVISNPANSNASAPNTNFSGFRVMPLCPQRSRQCTARKKLL